MEWTWLKDWWRLKRWRKSKTNSEDSVCFCDECLQEAENVIKSKFIAYKHQFLICTNIVKGLRI